MSVQRFKKFQIVDQAAIYHGPFPTQEELEWLVSENVKLMWDLTGYGPEVIIGFERVLKDRIKDFSAPTDIQGFRDHLNEVAQYLQAGKNIAVHCAAGIGRTGMALACLLVTMKQVSATEALRQVWQLCGGPEDISQMDFVLDLEGKV